MKIRCATTKERARGRWLQILPEFGIDARFLTGRNCPCPICGGKDRFRFLDRQPGDGMWVCNQCQPKPRPAIDLAVAYSGRPFREAARVIDDILGDRVVPMARRAPAPEDNTAKDVARARTCWHRGAPVRHDDITDRYLRHRCAGLDAYPSCLRTSPSEPYWNDGVVSRHPAMLALIRDPIGKPISVHRTYLATDGKDKADLDPPRKAVSPFGCGPTIRLAPAAPTMGIAEGIETALSAAKLFSVPVWSVISDYGIATFEPPPECERLIVFADHDRHGAGQRAADSLAKRLSIPAEIMMPEQPGDWNDVLVRG
jgi:putative DNA primase/helicase